ncbi:MAG TPA: fatty acid CoA ligase family protein [Opitutaceae bacterium]|nr:fatty acid CoA ligase family protein [Opitutaceae bacterium]
MSISTLSDSNANIARHLSLMAAAQPATAALKIPRGRTRRGEIDYLALDFAELDAEVAAWAARLASAGVQRGDRTLVMVRQGLPLIAAAFALFRVGAVPVIVDPGMGLKNFLACVARSRPRALVGIPTAQLVSRVFRGAFRSVQVRVAARGSLTARLTRSGARASASAPPLAASSPDELAAILFTSGSTGAPKGVCYEHGMFAAQVRLIRDTYDITPGEIDLPLLPIFALFNPALGMTTIVPEIDPRRPAEVDPVKIVQAIQQENVTNSFGSPTLWRKIAEHCVVVGTTLPTLRRVLCAGAPVPAALWKKSRLVLTGGSLHSPYGATEALPVASISAAEIDPASTRGACVGRAVREIEIKIIAISDRAIPALADARELPRGEIGEIIVRGPVVTKSYDAQPEPTALAKIPQIPNPEPQTPNPGPETPIWHRMGDCGYLDADGRLWFCGRKAERVETTAGTLHTEPCEQVFRAHPRVKRCALIGLGERGHQRVALVVEAKLLDSAQCRAFARELRALALEHEHTAAIRTFYFREKFPVDVRHNAKIHRLALARWAATATGFESDPKR